MKGHKGKPTPLFGVNGFVRPENKKGAEKTKNRT
jgi:hypothetical protein